MKYITKETRRRSSRDLTIVALQISSWQLDGIQEEEPLLPSQTTRSELKKFAEDINICWRNDESIQKLTAHVIVRSSF